MRPRLRTVVLVAGVFVVALGLALLWSLARAPAIVVVVHNERATPLGGAVVTVGAKDHERGAIAPGGSATIEVPRGADTSVWSVSVREADGRTTPVMQSQDPPGLLTRLADVRILEGGVHVRVNDSLDALERLFR